MSTLAIHPSILSCDFARLAEELDRIRTAEAAHVDVMDNHFVPNLTLGLPVVEAIRAVSPVPLDLHLMIEEVDRWGPRYAEIGAQSVTFHVEASRDPRTLCRDIRSAGASPAMALKPGTPFADHADLLSEVDMVLVMTVEPGFGGQAFMADQLEKVREVRRAVGAAGLELAIQVDGGVSAETIASCAEAGADVFVAGSAVYGTQDPAAAVQELRALAEEARRG
ncbi:ribulose-5-phosphate 3-epimerase [Kytococcus aerolatus]|uniref:Ribulose-phosphate 3-epimerase n=1 Tax=Kytococcus aerolatus TaxID=592308 RepID=A0A212T0H4_9MICO|nr:ribulose-phosphate 3-epimerase [Kytococcus aerolatus]SNC59331.1 ribulose-5-phosphate 3-epimerase [Kytococcus aerolatus]